MKIYTKTGDKGTTSLFGGQRVDKNSARIKAYGEVDELNSMIGVILSDSIFLSLRGALRFHPGRRSNLPSRHSGERSDSRIDSGQARMTGTADIKKKLFRIQNELFVLGADLATPKDVKVKIPRVTKSFIIRLEKEIDKWSASLPQLKNFILPGGGKVGSKLHLARTIARRAERSIVELADHEKINKNAQIYINRLSDWFFTLARYVNKIDGDKEVIWKGRN